MAASALSLAELNAAVQRASGGRLAATIDGSPVGNLVVNGAGTELTFTAPASTSA